MLLLQFRFANHASFRDEATLTLVSDGLTTNTPADGDWIAHTQRVAAIYGANASGKTSVLNAMIYMQEVIRHSATSWSKRPTLPRRAFKLDDHSTKAPSSFVLDFVLEGRRYEYGFSLNRERILEEWLYDYPSTRRRVLFDREGDDLVLGRGLGVGAALLRDTTGIRELLVSRAALTKQPVLSRVADAISRAIDVTKFGESDRQGRIRQVIADLMVGDLNFDDLELMLRVADVGIKGAEIDEGKTDPRVEKILRAVIRESSDDEDLDDEGVDSQVAEVMKEAGRALRFEHRGERDQSFQLSMNLQSTGTLTWLALAAPAIRAIRQGSVYLIDELDASLHPQLSQVLVQMFRNRDINRSGAQLIFTTHDTYYLSPSSGDPLKASEVYFVEKSREGASELFSLADFSTRDADNFSRRYLQGRYGALPAVAPAFLQSLVPSPSPGETESSSEVGIES